MADDIGEMELSREKEITADEVDSLAEPILDRGIDNEHYIEK
jgi:hypothetical protein